MVRQLRSAAAGGDVRAARELRGWLTEGFGRPTEQAPDDPSAHDLLPPMTREQKVKLKATIEAELAAMREEGVVEPVEPDAPVDSVG